jgi:hypothetical protein
MIKSWHCFECVDSLDSGLDGGGWCGVCIEEEVDTHSN